MSTALVWFRRDLRVHDHPSLVRALAEHDRVVPCFPQLAHNPARIVDHAVERRRALERYGAVSGGRARG